MKKLYHFDFVTHTYLISKLNPCKEQLVNQIHKLKIVNNTQVSATNTPNTFKKIQLVKHARKVDPPIGAISIPAPMFM